MSRPSLHAELWQHRCAQWHGGNCNETGGLLAFHGHLPVPWRQTLAANPPGRRLCVPSSPPTGPTRLKVVQLFQTLRVPRLVCECVSACVWTPVLTFRFLAPCARCLEMLPLKRSVYICRHYTHNFTPVALSPFAFAFSVHIIIYSHVLYECIGKSFETLCLSLRWMKEIKREETDRRMDTDSRLPPLLFCEWWQIIFLYNLGPLM